MSETSASLQGKWPEPTEEAPGLEQLAEWESEGGCEATDGCWVEPDGVCEHGWLLTSSSSDSAAL